MKNQKKLEKNDDSPDDLGNLGNLGKKARAFPSLTAPGFDKSLLRNWSEK